MRQKVRECGGRQKKKSWHEREAPGLERGTDPFSHGMENFLPEVCS